MDTHKGSFNMETYDNNYINKMIQELLVVISFEKNNVLKCLEKARYHGKVLDLGCGPGGGTEIISTYSEIDEVYGVDIESRFVEYAISHFSNSKIKYVQGDCYGMPFSDDTFDCCYSRYLFQHLKKPHLALKEIKRVVKPNGIIGIHDVDYDLIQNLPEIPFAQKIKRINYLLKKYKYGDIYIGRKLEEIMAQSGIVNINVYMTKTDNRTDKNFIKLFLNEEDNREFIINNKLMTSNEIDTFILEANKFINNKDSYFSIGNYFVYGINA